ncbi:tetraspanin-6-like [Kryptolebias marmoratus]|uniref:Tetraspanin-6-like n=1 Tax=Kryptolebias marmoratus TaxID=37003 RepID=A0A3Q3AKQ8_KRYMA|nr:tetraspanin-6-like [Kryptolebias marmoratus]
MGKVNVCLKRTYIGVICVIGTILILLLGLTIYAHSHFLDSEEVEVNQGLLFNYVFCTINLIIVIIGGFGVWKEKKWALIVFAVGATLIFLFLLGHEIYFQLGKEQIENTIRNFYITILPLANATEWELTFLNHTQTKFQCCGVESYRDWENNIPESCVCDDESTNPCMVAPRDINVLMRGQNIRIYSKPCLPLVIEEDLHVLQVTSGLRVGFMSLWVLSVGLCAAILCQIYKKLETPPVVYSSEARTGNYSCLIEAPDY